MSDDPLVPESTAVALLYLGTEDGRAIVTESGQPFVLEIAIHSSGKG